ncbi:MAG: AlwI family type II restriction endonuclease [Bacteroidales bacterium]
MKPWSISTTVRNPERVRSFLSVLKQLEGQKWDEKTQAKYQVLLLQNRLYGVYNKQFYNGLNENTIDLLESNDPISYKTAENILLSKNYKGGNEMRGRQSYNPIRKMGFVYTDKNKVLRFTDVANYFLQDDYDLGEVFFRSFIKWQLPNPDASDFSNGYNIKPFIATLHLINEVNKLCEENNDKAKGISRLEFQLFALTLFNYKNIKQQAKKVIEFRKKYNTAKNKDEFVSKYIADNLQNIESINNLNDYADNVIRYFRLTKYIYLRGNGYYLDLEPRRQIEIENLLKFDNACVIEFKNKQEHYAYLGNINEPALPWENKEDNIKIANLILDDISQYTQLLNEQKEIYEKKDINALNYEQLKEYISYLRSVRLLLQRRIQHNQVQELKNIEETKTLLQNIYSSKAKKSVELERLCSLALNALDDAKEIKPNYPVGDDNEPTFTAPANKPDIECFYEQFNAICEVTILTDKTQFFYEGQPVMRHLRDFEDKHNDKTAYCLFIAPSLHRDTINTFWGFRKIAFEGFQQRIIPLTITQFISLLDVLIDRKSKGEKLYYSDMQLLYDAIIQSNDNSNTSAEWILSIDDILTEWKNKITA